ncbi:hypothetical protein Tco_0878824 [Tanacetum coccineum]|uniref:Uncharacterized protein n=1 Tax=Tanacetum coccineum TaxID=301880 RepID=A0ABQ5C2F0_9ASTR
MAILKFADTHNMVAFLSKPAESDGFEQIVDFLNAHPIKYALTVNPTIYTSCIEQFWSTVKVKTINGEVQLHALVDGKKIIITESTVRRDLQLEDAEGVDCLPNSTIFEQLALMGYEKISQKLTFYKPFFSPQWKFLIHTILQCLSPKTTAWNEFSSTMASAIICLATNQKFNFSKYIFESMVRNLDNLSRKFLMYPRFVQVFLDQQLDGMLTHKRIYITPSHTKKFFGNMRRVGKGFSGRVTPLFPTMVVQNQSELSEGSANPTDPHHTPTIIQSSTQPQKTQKPRKPKRKDTQVPQPSDPSENVADEAVHKELGDSLVRAATTASSLEAEQDSGNITKTRSKATPNESSSLGTTSGGGLRCQETIRDTTARTRFKSVSKNYNDSLLARGNTLRSDEDRLKLDELMALCTTLQTRVLDLEKTKTTQQNEIDIGLSARVESSGDKESLGKDASKQGRINAIDVDEEITLVSVHDDADKEMFDVDALNGEEVFVAGQNENIIEEVVDSAQVSTAATTVTITTKEITLAQALKALKPSNPKVKRVVIQEPGESTTTKSLQLSSQQSQDKGKGIMIEPVKPMKKKDQISFDEETAKKLQAEFDEEERLAREKAEKEKEANIALIEEWDDIQAKIDDDHQLAKRLHAQEQEELSDAEKATLFQQLLEKRRKHFSAKRAEEQRNKPSTQAQQRKIMCTYLKNMEGFKLKDLKSKGFDSIQEMFDFAFKRVNTFEDFRTELMEGKEQRAGEELIQENIKKQKVDDDKEIVELNSVWKLFQMMKRIFSQMLKSFDREDLEDLYKLVKARYGSTRPVESMNYLLWNDMKIMFEPHVEDEVCKLQNGYKVLEWKLYDSYGVHFLRMQSMQIYMLVENKYPLTPPTISMMLDVTPTFLQYSSGS